MNSSEWLDDIDNFNYVMATASALYGFICLAYIMSDVTLWFFGVDVKFLQLFLIFLYSVLISFLPKVRACLSPLMVPELNWQIYRYTGGLLIISADFMPNKFIFFIVAFLYGVGFYCIAKREADKQKAAKQTMKK